MNKRDIGVIVGIAVVAGIFSLVISSLLFGGSKSYNLKAPQVQPISADFIAPSEEYFNSKAINPTVDIKIGGPINPDIL